MSGYTQLEQPGSGNHVGIRQALFKAHIALADYPQAEAYLQEALQLSEKIHGAESVSFHKVLLDAALLDNQVGKYEAAKEKLVKVLHRFERQWGDNNMVSEVLAQLAAIEDELDNRPQAAAYASRAYSIAKWFPEYKSANYDEVLLNIAGVNLSLQNYPFADSLYRAVLARSEGEYYRTQKAKALSGIALIEMGQGQYKGAGEKLEQAIAEASQAVGEAHPMLATLYYNKSRLLLEKGNIGEALKEAVKARSITNRYFAANHVDHGDLNMLLGEIVLKENKVKEAALHFKKAEEIYKPLYKNSHWKRQHVAEKLRLIRVAQGEVTHIT